jgi:hypothetical protein
MIDGLFEFAADGRSVGLGDARHQNSFVGLTYFRRDGGDLVGCFAFAKNDFGEVFAQRAVQIDFGKSEVPDWRGLESAQDFLPANVARFELF